MASPYPQIHHDVQALPDHPPADLHHPGQVDVRFDLGEIVEDEDLLGDVRRHVPDPLQMAGDLDGRRNEAQITRGGLPKGQQADALLLQIHVERSISFVLPDDPSRQLRSFVPEARRTRFKGLFRQVPR